MADNTVDNILLELDATTDKADGGIKNTIKNLKSLKEVTEGIDTNKLTAIRDVFNNFKTAGEGLKQAGDGMRSVVSAVRSLSKIDSGKLKEVANAVEKIGTGLGNLGSNNKISIRIDSEGIDKAVKPLQEARTSSANTQNANAETRNLATVSEQVRNAMDVAAQSIERVASAEERVASTGNVAASAQQTFAGSVNRINSSSANAQIQGLINKINEYKAIISGMESGKQLFDASAYEEAVNGLKRVQEQFNQYQESVKNAPKSMEDVANSINTIGDAARKCGLDSFSSLLNNIASMLPSIEMGGMAASAGFQSMATGLQAVQAAIPVIGIILTLISALVNAVNFAANKIKAAFEKIKSGFETVVNKIRQGITGLISKLNEFRKKISSTFSFQEYSFKSLSKKLKSVSRLFTFMMLRKLITKMFEGAITGFENLVYWSKLYGTKFHKNVSLLYSDLKWFSNSMATVFEPILNYLTPILDFLISKLVQATNALAQFFAALTGSSTWTKARRNIEEYTTSVEKAQKAMKGLLSGIDELNVLSSNNDSGSGSGINPEDWFSTEQVGDKFKDLADMLKEAWENADFYDIGRLLGEKLKKALESIPWNKIKENLRKIGKSIATLLNGLNETPRLFRVIGQTLAQVINSVFEFIDAFAWAFHWDSFAQAIVDAVQGLVDAIDWNLIYHAIYGIASGIADFFNTIFGAKKTWADLGKTIANAINAVIHGVFLLVSKFNFADFGQSIALGLGNAISNISYWKIGRTLATGINGIFDALYNFSETFPWKETAIKFTTGVNRFFENLEWDKIKAGFTSFCAGLGKWLGEAISNTDFHAVGESLGNALMTIIQGIGSFLDEIDPVELGSSIADFINGVFDAFNSQDAVDTINSIIDWFKTVFGTAIEGVNWTEIVDDIGTLLAGIDWATVFQACFAAIAGAWVFEKIFDNAAIVLIGTSIIGGIKEGVDNALSEISAWIYEHLFKPVVDAINNAFGISNGSSAETDQIGQNVVAGFLEGITTAWVPMPLKVAGMCNDLLGWFKENLGVHSPSTKMLSIGENVVQGFINGITGKLGDVKSAITTWASNVMTWFKEKLGINSPSKEFAEMGGYTIEGYNSGIESAAKTTKGVMSDWIDSFSDMNFSLGMKFNVDDSALQGYQNNYGSDFESNIVHKLKNAISIDKYSSGTESTDNSFVEDESEQERLLREQNDLLRQILEKDSDVQVDGKSLLSVMMKEASIYKKANGKPAFAP